MFTERTSRVQEIMTQMAAYKEGQNATKSSTSYNPHKKIQLYKELKPVNRDEMRETMRAKQKKSWRGRVR